MKNPADKYGISGNVLSFVFLILFRNAVPITAKSSPVISPAIPFDIPRTNTEAGMNFTSAPPILLPENTAQSSINKKTTNAAAVPKIQLTAFVPTKPSKIKQTDTASATFLVRISQTDA